MSITIEVNGTRIDCQDEASARKALRQAAAQDRKRQTLAMARRAIAGHRAQCAAFSILSACSDLERGKQYGYTLARADGSDYERECFHKAITRDGRTVNVTLQTEEGPATLHLYSYTPEIIITRGSGYDVAVKVRDVDHPEITYWMAAGVEEGEVNTVVMEGQLALLLNTLVAEMMDYRAQRAKEKAAAMAAYAPGPELGGALDVVG